MKTPNNRVVLTFQLLLLGALAGCSRSLGLVDRPIRFDAERKELSRAYMAEHYGLIRNEAWINPSMVVVHWTGLPDLETSYGVFYSSRLGDTRPDILGGGALNVSAHYLVDRDGRSYRLLPDTVMARHVIGLNHCAIGIENVGGTAHTPLTRRQLRANVRLIRSLMDTYPIEYVIGHYEYTSFEGNPLWLEIDSTYRTEKVDPGEAFIRRIRRRLDPLKPLPVNNKS